MQKAYLHLIKWALSKDYSVEIECEGETDYSGQSYNEAKNAVEAVESGVIYLKQGGEYVAWFSFVFDYNQSPDEIINDWGINQITKQWSKEYHGWQVENAS